MHKKMESIRKEVQTKFIIIWSDGSKARVFADEFSKDWPECFVDAHEYVKRKFGKAGGRIVSHRILDALAIRGDLDGLGPSWAREQLVGGFGLGASEDVIGLPFKKNRDVIDKESGFVLPAAQIMEAAEQSGIDIFKPELHPALFIDPSDFEKTQKDFYVPVEPRIIVLTGVVEGEWGERDDATAIPIGPYDGSDPNQKKRKEIWKEECLQRPGLGRCLRASPGIRPLARGYYNKYDLARGHYDKYERHDIIARLQSWNYGNVVVEFSEPKVEPAME